MTTPVVSFDFNTIHYYGAWLFGTLFVLHACIKLPVVRRAYRERGVLKPLMQGVGQTEPEPPDGAGLAPVNPAAPRRSVAAACSRWWAARRLTIFAVQVGESIGGPFRSLALLAPRGRVFGTGPNDFPVTHTAASAEITTAMTGADWRLTVVGARTISFTRQQLLAMAQSTRTLTITCTDGWSTTQHWTGVRLASWPGWWMRPMGRSCARYHSKRRAGVSQAGLHSFPLQRRAVAPGPASQRRRHLARPRLSGAGDPAQRAGSSTPSGSASSDSRRHEKRIARRTSGAATAQARCTSWLTCSASRSPRWRSTGSSAAAT